MLCVFCKPKRFHLCYGLEVASVSSKVKTEMKESTGDPATRQTVELGEHCSGSSRGQAFSAISVFDAQGMFFPLCVSVHACA